MNRIELAAAVQRAIDDSNGQIVSPAVFVKQQMRKLRKERRRRRIAKAGIVLAIGAVLALCTHFLAVAMRAELQGCRIEITITPKDAGR